MAEIAATARGLAVEIPIEPDSGIDQASVINSDGLPTVSQRRLGERLGSVHDATLDEICGGLAAALGCEQRGGDRRW